MRLGTGAWTGDEPVRYALRCEMSLEPRWVRGDAYANASAFGSLDLGRLEHAGPTRRSL